MNQAAIQRELPLAYVKGEALINKPEDLFIPPHALEVILESFEGPLDLLLYLIRKQKFEIADIPIRQVTEQYMEYVELMKEVDLEMAAEYLLMAAMLAEIKSRILLPKLAKDDEEEADPRAELVRRLKEYEVIKKAAVALDEQPRLERDFFSQSVFVPDCESVLIEPDVDIRELVIAFAGVLKRASHFKHHQIKAETLSTRARMSLILERLSETAQIEFIALFTVEEGKSGVVVTFLAVLELLKGQQIKMVTAADSDRFYVSLIN
ncbi:segregation and condensation protein A [Gayadomonas joobiniege]|uniref:segregation and condensation protein A n=1 Tax=Gayadomonas joobiniege TaxID=1234606 RepID=UPI00037CEF0E|nr:segregation/condensation protein A [Gayadomonas joobiniege]